MFCPKCGTQNDDNAYRCVKCGEVLQEAAAPSAPPQRIPNYLVQSILVTLFCCLPLGIVAIVYAAQVNGKLQAGDVAGALNASKQAKTFCWISLAVGLALALIYVAIAIPKFASTKDKAYVASMRSDLRGLSVAEETYFADNNTYTSTFTNLNFQASANNTITFSAATASGWAATASSTGTSTTCGVFVGTATAPITGQADGEVRCK